MSELLSKKKEAMESRYLSSILVNHDQSEFCILEFKISNLSQPQNTRVVLSSGSNFSDIALSILNSINWEMKLKNVVVNSKILRLPIYFKN